MDYIQNTKYKIQNTKYKYKIQNGRFGIQEIQEGWFMIGYIFVALLAERSFPLTHLIS